MKTLKNYLVVILIQSGIILLWGCTEENDQKGFESIQTSSDGSLHYKSEITTDGLIAYYPFNGNANDESGDNNHGAVYGATLTEDRLGNINSAFSFDGIDDYIHIAHRAYLNVNPPGFTAAVWIKAKPEQNSGDRHYCILDKSHGYYCLGGATGWVIQGRTDLPPPNFGFIFGNGSQYVDGVGINNTILDDQWHLLTAVFDDQVTKFYLDGVLENTNTITGNPAHNTGVLAVGQFWCGFSHGWPARYFNGVIDDIRIYDRALTDDEIIALLNEGTTITVMIDIKPGSYPNCFNNNGHGVIPVAILGSVDFDVTQIDPSTVQLEGLLIRVVGKSSKYLAHIEDVNNDRFDDLVVQIEDSDQVFEEGTTTAKVTGNLKEEFGGNLFEGTDEICIVP